MVVGGEESGNREEHSESLKQHVQGSWGLCLAGADSVYENPEVYMWPGAGESGMRQAKLGRPECAAMRMKLNEPVNISC